MKTLIYPVFLPMQGCTHRCIYCDQNKISGADSLNIEKELVGAARFVANHAHTPKEIAFYGGSFTALSSQFRLELTDRFTAVIDDCTSFRISTHPLYINDTILAECKAQNIQCIELGIQDFCTEVLMASGRSYNTATAIKAAKLVMQKGFTLGIQLMPGLPASSETTITLNRQILARLMPNYLRIYPLIVLKGTPLAELYVRGDYTPLQMEEAISICADYAEFADQTGIRLIKTGLPSNLNAEDVLAGPYHPAFGEFVLAERLIRLIVAKLTAKQEIILDKKQRYLIMSHRGRFVDCLKKRLENCSLNPEEVNRLLS